MGAPEPFSQVESRHASIDPAVRAARGLPEDLIRLCVGIEDPNDLLDDLQHALLEAGAITIAANDFVRIPNAVNKAVEKLALGELRNDARRLQDDREWFVSAPGKVILFGEHAVVHGVVSSFGLGTVASCLADVLGRRLLQHLSTCVVTVSPPRVTTANSLSIFPIPAHFTMSGTSSLYPGMQSRASG